MSKAKRSAFWLTGLGLVAVMVLATPRAVHAVAAALVQVTNTTANPVITSRMDDPGRIPYLSAVASLGGCNNCLIHFPAVPPNHRLVIQHAIITGGLTGPGVVQGTISVGAIRMSSFFIPTALTGSLYSYAQDEPMLAFVDGGDAPLVAVNVYAGSSQNEEFEVSLSGYMLDCAAAPCSAIAQ
jgi:hypothetical protein